MTNRNTTSPALHHQNQPPDSGSVYESQRRQLWVSVHHSHRHLCCVCFCLECLTIFRGEKRRSLYCSSSSPQKSVCADDKSKVKVAVNTIVPRSPFFSFYTPKYSLLQTQNKMRSNVCVNEMALFGPFAAFGKGKTFFDSHGKKGGLPTRRDSGPTRYGCAPH